jgi:ubiquinone/menaquinone biosynthesis C-methylase UbiE
MTETGLAALATAVLSVEPEPERVLQIGCGEGDGVFFLAREYPRARIRGLDRSEESIRRAVARMGLDPEGRVAFKQGGRRPLPYPDDFFDLVVQTGGLLPPVDLTRVLRAGGWLIYLERSHWWWPLPPRSSRMARTLGRLGFELVELGEVAEEPFYVGRLLDAS